MQALGPSTRALPEKIDACERWYAAAGIPCLFRITPFTDPALEGHLDERGYVRDGRSHVMVRALDDGDRADEPETLELAEWIEIYARLSQLPAVPRALEALLRSAGPRRVLACVRDRHGAPVSVGMGALDGAAFGLFDLVTRAGARGRGHGRRLIGSLLSWARAHGATSAYLQVLQSNERAQPVRQRRLPPRLRLLVPGAARPLPAT
ncbi:MAG: GNAT family N-acetyltransferase [Gemmatimonadetes bacterium]|nr:GNAT family N-acetyltransferase [Gemmatimonadota bacterium]